MKPLDSFFDAPSSGPGHYPQRFRRLLFWAVRVFFTPLFRFKALDRQLLLEATAARPGRGLIIAANHQSYLDPVFILMSMRPLFARYIAKESFLQIPVIRRFAAWAGVFPLKRGTADMKAVKRAVSMLKRGENLGIFPEGTRIRKPGQERVYHEGIALIAHLAHADVLPVRIWGSERICPEGTRLWRFPKIRMRYGQPLSLEEERFASLPKDERLQAFTQAVMDSIYMMEEPR